MSTRLGLAAAVLALSASASAAELGPPTALWATPRAAEAAALKVVERAHGQLARCTVSEPPVSGADPRVELRFTIGKDGKVGEVAAAGDFLDVDCARDAVRGWKFGRQKKEVAISYRFQLSSKAEERQATQDREKREVGEFCEAFRKVVGRVPDEAAIATAVDELAQGAGLTEIGKRWSSVLGWVRRDALPGHMRQLAAELGVTWSCPELDAWAERGKAK